MKVGTTQSWYNPMAVLQAWGPASVVPGQNAQEAANGIPYWARHGGRHRDWVRHLQAGWLHSEDLGNQRSESRHQPPCGPRSFQVLSVSSTSSSVRLSCRTGCDTSVFLNSENRAPPC